MGAVQKAVAARFDEMRQEVREGAMTQDEYDKWEKRRFEAEEDWLDLFSFDMEIIPQGIMFIGLGGFLFRHGGAESFFGALGLAVFGGFFGSLALLLVAGLVAWILSLILGEAIGEALLFGLLVTMTLLLYAFWFFVDRTTTEVPISVWVALGAGILFTLWRTRDNIERHQRLRLLFDSMPK